MKTPKKLAEDYASKEGIECYECGGLQDLEKAFLAGYKVATSVLLQKAKNLYFCNGGDILVCLKDLEKLCEGK